MIKQILNITLFILIICGLSTLLALVNDARHETICKQLHISITNDKDYQLIDSEEIKKIFREQGIKIVGNPLKHIDITKLERILNSHPHIKKAEVYADLNGDVSIIIQQRKPVIRVFNVYNESYYIDEDGWLMPLSEKSNPRVPVANGLIFEKFDKFYRINFSDTLRHQKIFKHSLLDDLFLIGKAISSDSLWRRQIQQIYVEKEIELIPRVGQQEIILGDVSSLHEKLDKLRIFYTEAIPKIGWNKYGVINLKFKNQIVCTKAEKN